MSSPVRETELRESLRLVLKGVLAIFVLQVLRSFAGSLPGAERALGSLRIGDYLFVLISLFVLAVLLRVYRPLKLVLVFYSSALIKGARMPSRERHRQQLLRLAESLVLLLYLFVFYDQLTPALARLGPGFTGMQSAITFAQIAALLVGLWVLLMIWSSAQPLIEAVTGGIAESVARASAGALSKACQACGTSNEPDAEFCVACGGRIAIGIEAAGAEFECPKCATWSPAHGRFCRKCGAPFATRPELPAAL